MVSLGSPGQGNELLRGLVAVYSRALRSGEYVMVGETGGRLCEDGALATKIARSQQTEAVTVPNAVLMESAITKSSRPTAIIRRAHLRRFSRWQRNQRSPP
jgi:small-conductance mechanosensitive channel